VESNGSARVALVKGVARGIGRGIALRLASNGLDVAVNDLEADREDLEGVTEEIRNEGRRMATVFADVSDADEVEGMVQASPTSSAVSTSWWRTPALPR
jgi:meso-butanediol dehydrogenase / (S,S)-butanediol dehydrogenase / diacetyl reductase